MSNPENNINIISVADSTDKILTVYGSLTVQQFRTVVNNFVNTINADANATNRPLQALTNVSNKDPVKRTINDVARTFYTYFVSPSGQFIYVKLEINRFNIKSGRMTVKFDTDSGLFSQEFLVGQNMFAVRNDGKLFGGLPDTNAYILILQPRFNFDNQLVEERIHMTGADVLVTDLYTGFNNTNTRTVNNNNANVEESPVNVNVQNVESSLNNTNVSAADVRSSQAAVAENLNQAERNLLLDNNDIEDLDPDFTIFDEEEEDLPEQVTDPQILNALVTENLQTLANLYDYTTLVKGNPDIGTNGLPGSFDFGFIDPVLNPFVTGVGRITGVARDIAGDLAFGARNIGRELYTNLPEFAITRAGYGIRATAMLLPKVLFSRWSVLAITSSVVVGSFTYLLYNYYPELKDKIAEKTADFVNSVSVYVPYELVYNGYLKITTHQELIDCYISYLKSADFTQQEKDLIDPLLDNLVVYTVTDPSGNVASYIEVAETMSRNVEQGNQPFRDILQTYDKKSDKSISPVNYILSAASILGKAAINLLIGGLKIGFNYTTLILLGLGALLLKYALKK